MNVSERLIALRKQRGFTQNALAEWAGVSQTHLRRVELGQADITVGHLQLLCDAMGVEGVPSYFVIDREGSIRYKSVGFPGVSKIKDELKKELNK